VRAAHDAADVIAIDGDGPSVLREEPTGSGNQERGDREDRRAQV
jgi:hypothetical protein